MNEPFHRVLFWNDDSVPVFEVSSDKEFYELGKKYELYCGGKIFYCESCGKEGIKKSNRQFLCDECWKKKEMEKNREYVRKHRRKSM